MKSQKKFEISINTTRERGFFHSTTLIMMCMCKCDLMIIKIE